jgi:hypothetical protein
MITRPQFFGLPSRGRCHILVGNKRSQNLPPARNPFMCLSCKPFAIARSSGVNLILEDVEDQRCAAHRLNNKNASSPWPPYCRSFAHSCAFCVSPRCSLAPLDVSSAQYVAVAVPSKWRRLGLCYRTFRLHHPSLLRHFICYPMRMT